MQAHIHIHTCKLTRSCLMMRNLMNCCLMMMTNWNLRMMSCCCSMTTMMTTSWMTTSCWSLMKSLMTTRKS